MKWTTETPTQEGFYWWRISWQHEANVCKVKDWDGELAAHFADPNDVVRVEKYKNDFGEWAGPIPEPSG